MCIIGLGKTREQMLDQAIQIAAGRDWDRMKRWRAQGVPSPTRKRIQAIFARIAREERLSALEVEQSVRRLNDQQYHQGQTSA